MLPLVLINGSARIESLGLLDTGADVNVLPYHLGLELGIVWDEQRTFVRLSGNLANFDARGLLLLAQTPGFTSVKLVFAWSRSEETPLILGQVNFFMLFDACFYRSRSLFEISTSSSDKVLTG